MRYGMKRMPKEYDLEEYGYKIKRTRPKNTKYIQIEEIPQDTM